MSTVLIVDDEPDIRSIARLQLEGAGYTVAEARDGFEALSVLKEAKPDVLLLDLQMPRMSGLEFLEKLRRTEAEVPVVIFSANDDPIVLRQIAALGFQGQVCKPYRAADLIDAVGSAAARKVP